MRNLRHGKLTGAAAIVLTAGILLSGCGTDNTDNELAYRQIGINAMESGDYEGAVENFQNALDQSGGKIRELEKDICMQKAEALYRNGQTEDAIQVCDAVLDYDKDYANAYCLRGNMYLQQDNSEQALADYAQAAKHADADFDIYVQLYENLSRAGMQEEGETYLEQALELKGKSRYYLTNRGYIYYLMGDYEQAKEELTQALAIEQKEGEDDKAELFMAMTADRLGDTATAESCYESYAESHADNSQVLEELGNIAMEKGDYAKAYSYYRQGLQVEKPSNEQQLRRGEIAALEQQYEFEQAAELMAQYVADYPNDEEAARENLFLKTRTAVADQIEQEQAEMGQEETN